MSTGFMISLLHGAKGPDRILLRSSLGACVIRPGKDSRSPDVLLEDHGHTLEDEECGIS